MESSSMVERALKSGFRSKAEGQHVVAVEDGLLGLGGVSLVACNDDFVVDDLFDFSNDDGEVEEEEEEEEDDDDEGQEAKESLCVSSQEGDDDCSNISSSSSASGEPSLASELTVPVTDFSLQPLLRPPASLHDVDIAELEWLSQFVDDDSLPETSTCYLTGKWKQESSAKNRPEQEPRPVFIRPPCFPSPVPVKIRTKRTRAVKKDRPPSSSESSSTSSCSSENSSSSCLSFTSVLTGMQPVRGQGEPEKKKMKKTRGPPVQAGPVQFQRRCSHCQVQKTPQWRAGPLGPKTLCNACGVRYKSGRLFPEYRPACSPTFSVEAHSNSHRKVLDMRRRKEMAGDGIEGGGLKSTRKVIF